MLAIPTDAAETRAESGELRLIAAVLQRAILDARAGCAEARRWIASDAPSVGAGWSYAAVCDLLALDPGWARAQIARGGRPARRPRMRFARLEAA